MKAYTIILILFPLLSGCFSQKKALRNDIQIENIVKNAIKEDNAAQSGVFYQENTSILVANLDKYNTAKVLTPSKKINEELLVSADKKAIYTSSTWLVEKVVKKAERKPIKEQEKAQKLKIKNNMDEYETRGIISLSLLIAGVLLVLIGGIFNLPTLLIIAFGAGVLSFFFFIKTFRCAKE